MSSGRTFVAVVALAILVSASASHSRSVLAVAKGLAMAAADGRWEGTCWQMAYTNTDGSKASCAIVGIIVNYTFSATFDKAGGTYSTTVATSNYNYKYTTTGTSKDPDTGMTIATTTTKNIAYYIAPFDSGLMKISSVVSRRAGGACVSVVGTYNSAFVGGINTTTSGPVYVEDGTVDTATNTAVNTCPLFIGMKGLYCKDATYTYHCEATPAAMLVRPPIVQSTGPNSSSGGAVGGGCIKNKKKETVCVNIDNTCTTAKDGKKKTCEWTSGKSVGKKCTYTWSTKKKAFNQVSCTI